MIAYVSGSTGVAVYSDGAQNYRVTSRDYAPTMLDDRLRGKLLAMLTDAEMLDVPTVETVMVALRNSVEKYRALYLTLSVLDSEIPTESRQEFASFLDDQLRGGTISSFIENVLCAQKQPPDADFNGAISLCRKVKAFAILEIYKTAQSCLREISTISDAWQAIPAVQFGSDADRKRFQSACVRQGIFRDMICCISRPDREEALLRRAEVSPELRVLPGYADVIRRWTSNLATLVDAEVPQNIPFEPFVPAKMAILPVALLQPANYSDLFTSRSVITNG